MIEFFTILTIICLLLPVYIYIGYPLTLFFLTKWLSPKPIKQRAITPSVAMMVSCYNEIDVIRKKLENCLALDYPSDLLEIIVVSDGSDDGTDEVVKEFEHLGIRLIRQEGRLGKTSGLNLGVSATDAEIVVFSDANAMYEAQAIRKLMRNFNDPEVGYVVGAALYTDDGENAAASSENAYWKYEIFVKRMESQLHSVVGGDGAIYAIRKALYIPLAREDINDFVNPLQIIMQGYRGVFDEEAKCFEETAGDFDKEGRRKERIVNRSFRGLIKCRAVMNPFKTGFYSFEIVSHKLLRWLVPIFLVGILVGTSYLSHFDYDLAKELVFLEVLFFWFACFGYFFSEREGVPKIFYYPYYFLMVNYRSLLGVVQALKGNVQVTWSSPRSDFQSRDGIRKVSPAGAALIIFSIYLFFLVV